ncbi:MAG: DUF3168 domain-containing protein [Pseudomonadota bacterium]
MTYALSWPLQEAVYAVLKAAPAVTALAGGHVYDAAPAAKGGAEDMALYAVIGDETVRNWGSADTPGAEHRLAVNVYAAERSFSAAKALAGAISDVLSSAALNPSRGRVVCLSFLAARTRREERDRVRRIELIFRVLVEDTA